MKTTSQRVANEIDWPKAIVRNLIDAIVVMDTHGAVQYVNPAACRLTGLAPSTSLGHPAHELFRFLDRGNRKPLEFPTPRSFRDQPPDKPVPIVFTQALLASPHQRELIVNAIFTPIRLDGGPVTGIIIRFRDVTQSVQLERKERDRQKIQAISTMANSIAGEFTNWLSLISGHAASIVDNLIPRTRAYEEAVNILDATRRASGLTKRLLSIARTSDGKETVKLRSVSLDSIVRSAVNQAQSVFGTTGITFKVKPASNIPPVLADGAQLLDCLMNLFRNAFDAMPEGGTITVDFPASRGPFPHRQYVIIRIRDTGRGMEKRVMERAFDPFFSTKDPAQAIGLGLTIVQTSLEQWGGMVKIRSRPEHGASVRMFLRPARAGQPGAEQEAPMPAAQILLVDDQESLRNDLGVVLESAGYQAHTTGDADECLDFYQRHANEIDLLLIDVVMPGKDGKHLLDEILAINPQATVIMTSGFSRDYVRNYVKRGTWGFVQKPVEPDHLLATVQRMLKREEP